MKISRRIAVPTDVIETIFCNKCGLSCQSPAGDSYGLIEVEVTGGYYSTHLKDGDVHKFSLCESCVAQMVESFKYPSKQGNYMFPEDDCVEDFDPHKYWPEGTILHDDPEFQAMLDAVQPEFEPVSVEELFDSEDSFYSVDDDEIEEFLEGIPQPNRIKKEDMN